MILKIVKMIILKKNKHIIKHKKDILKKTLIQIK